VIFVDRSIPKGVAEALQRVRNDVEWLEPRFAHDTADVEWLTEAGNSGWLVVSRDKRVSRRPAELRAIREHGVGCFIITARKHLTKWEYLKLFASNLDQMIEIFDATERPFIWTVELRGIARKIL
jgi:predicted nuclease of predicted toxin-antitoxin system